jgi:hypothetical protein
MTPTWQTRNIFERFLWTFIQAAVGAVSVAQATAAIAEINLSTMRVIGLTALGAGVAAVISLAKNLTSEGIVVQAAKRAQEGGAVPEAPPATVVTTTVETPPPAPPKPRTRTRKAAAK